MRGSGTSSPLAIPSRVKALPAFFGILLIGIVPLALALPGLLGFLHGMAHRAPLVVLKPREAVGPPLALAAFALAGITLSSPAIPGRGRSSATRRPRPRRVTWTGACLAIVLAAMLGTVIAIPVVEIAASATMTSHGYLRCPDPRSEWRPPMRWVLPGGHCP